MLEVVFFFRGGRDSFSTFVRFSFIIGSSSSSRFRFFGVGGLVSTGAGGGGTGAGVRARTGAGVSFGCNGFGRDIVTKRVVTTVEEEPPLTERLFLFLEEKKSNGPVLESIGATILVWKLP